MINKIKELMNEAHKHINEADAAKENEKLGTLRAGSSGALLSDSKKGQIVFATSCGRLAQARYLGQQQAPTAEMRAMFNGGFALEDYIEKQLIASNVSYRKEQGVEAELESGICVQGRPDFDIEINGEWIGVEVKSLASPFSVIKQVKNGFPFLKHLLQAATYAMLCKRDKWLIAIGHSFYVNQNGHKIDPGLRWYQLNRANGEFTIQNDKDEQMKLPFKEVDIVEYYRAIQSGIKSKQLMARPTEKELRVDTYNRCNYCHMSSQCNLYDNGMVDFDTWILRVSLNKENPGDNK